MSIIPIFSNKNCDDSHTISINGMDIKRVFVTKFLGVHLYFQLNWSKHFSIYNLYCTLILPYLNTVVKHGAICTRVLFIRCILFRNRQLGFVEM